MIDSFLKSQVFEVSSVSAINYGTASLSWINAKQIFKKSLSLLTFFIGGFVISCSNLSGIALTCLDVNDFEFGICS